jgi:hypothetical protein
MATSRCASDLVHDCPPLAGARGAGEAHSEKFFTKLKTQRGALSFPLRPSRGGCAAFPGVLPETHPSACGLTGLLGSDQ